MISTDGQCKYNEYYYSRVILALLFLIGVISIIVFYFSGTGNTKYVSKELSKKLGGEAFDIVGLENQKAVELIKNNDIVFLAYPIYGSDMPENMKDFVDNMPNVSCKKLGVICTQLLFSGDGASIAYKKLIKKGYDYKWAFQINMPNNLCAKGSPFSQSSDYAVHEKKHLVKARTKIEEIASYVKDDKKKLCDNTIFHTALGIMQRLPYNSRLRVGFTKKFNIKQDTCIKCGLCERICPNGVISVKGDEYIFENRDKCTACFRCINFCKTKSIHFGKGIKLPQYLGPTKEIYSSIIRGK